MQNGTLSKHARTIATRFPGYRERILKTADLALAGRQTLPGTSGEPFHVGDPPAWHANPVDDNEYVWGLNRMYHWRPLLWAHVFTGEARYARKVVEELDDWIANCPRPPLAREHYHAVTPWRSLEAGIRMFDSWSCVLRFLRDTPFLPPERYGRLLASVREHAEVLAEICPQLWPQADHNHYLMENLGLLALSTRCPDLAGSEAWRAHSRRELERCAKAQIAPEGGQLEGCPHYHNGCVAWFARAALLARAAGDPLSDAYHHRLERMLEYTVHSFRPSGSTVPWGDSDATVKDAASAAVYGYLATHAAGPMAFLKALVGKEPLQDALLDAAWEVDDVAARLDVIDALDASTVRWPLVNHQKALDQVALRTAWDRDALSVFFACRTPVNNGHAHIDPMGFDFTGLGRPLVVDPGRYTYREDDDRRRFKSAAWHNTLTIDNRDPFEYLGTWRYGPQKEGHIVAAGAGPGLLAASAEHHNYAPVVHRRAIGIVDGEFLLVLDDVCGLPPGATVQLHYHLDFTDATTTDRRAEAKGADVSLVIGVTPGLVASTRPGRVSDRIDVSRPSSLLRFEDGACPAARRRYATVLVPYKTACGVPDIGDPELFDADGDWGCSVSLRGTVRAIRWRQLAEPDRRNNQYETAGRHGRRARLRPVRDNAAPVDTPQRTRLHHASQETKPWPRPGEGRSPPIPRHLPPSGASRRRGTPMPSRTPWRRHVRRSTSFGTTR